MAVTTNICVANGLTNLTPIFAEAVLKLDSQVFAPCFQRLPSVDDAKISADLIPGFPDEAVWVIEALPQSLLHWVIKVGLIGLPCSLYQPL